MESEAWSVLLYVSRGGTVPVADFLAGLDLRTQARFRRAIEALLERNVHAREPLVRHLSGKLWEVRIESDTNIYRVIYAFAPGRRIVLLHGFQKKTQRTPAREIDTAEIRLAEFQVRQGE